MPTLIATKTVTTTPLKITIAIPPENPTIKGYFTGHARVRSKADNKALLEKFADWAGEGDADEALVRELYDSFSGLGDDAGNELTGEAAFDAVLRGPLSAYLTPAVVQAYYEQYGEARQGNFARRRSR